ncbi:MAG: rhodanese-like domain-containing protein [Ferruginibacter sp.]|nr:rhodanese-like domain-containing protein [Chitinophagaceae bacterium]MBP6286999.1 rhodanese-like domain-containing protein [Ferruginibacter sp.]MBU9936211.1 rhodanese-like domain-containing protein [Ferruginibacter sp.]HQY11720.1 rhodanese-like domain-containing protein [Ferruginibacter sp.]
MTIITVDEIKTRMDTGEQLNLLDVREAGERAEFNIGGTFIPLGNIVAMQTDDIEDWKNEEVICYCRSGNRSMQACLVLETFGFTNVKNLQGGMNGWREKYT